MVAKKRGRLVVGMPILVMRGVTEGPERIDASAVLLSPQSFLSM